jgi:YHS domain-containing protein
VTVEKTTLLISNVNYGFMRMCFLTLLVTTCFFAFAQTEQQRQKHFNIKKNLALEGYDVVSYFGGSPLEGSEKLQVTHKGITYRFASSDNLNKFKSNPEQYEPAYGGWCAYAMGKTGEKIKVDPETFKILKGKLYLFYNFWGNNTLHAWNEQEQGLREAADRNWNKNLQ